MARFAVFKITRTKALNTPVLVDFTTVDGTATAADGDYTATAGTAQFLAGQTEVEVQVPVRSGNQGDEEAFKLVLSNPRRAAVIGAEATATLPAGAGLDSFFPLKDLGVLFYVGEKHPGDGPALSDSEWVPVPGPGQQSDGTPFPGVFGQFDYDLGAFVLSAGGGPILTASGFYLHYLVQDNGNGTSFAQVLVTNRTQLSAADSTLDPATAAAFNTWWDSLTSRQIVLLDANGTILGSGPMSNATDDTVDPADPTTMRMGNASSAWTQDNQALVAKIQLIGTPR